MYEKVGRLVLSSRIASLNNDDGDSNGNGKKAIGYFARASRCFVHFSAVIVRLHRESALIHVLSRTETQDNNFLFLFPNFDEVFQHSTPEKFAYELNEME